MPDRERDLTGFAEEAEAALQLAFGPEARFRHGQLEAIEKLVIDGERLLVVQRTGWGKSIVYFVATKLLRARGGGPTIIISPLLALMRDQLAAAERIGVRAATINSSNLDEWDATEQSVLSGDTDILLVSPERLNNPEFRERVLVPMADRAGLFVIDEAHCISDWGHDFRPDYRRIARVINLLPAGVPVLCTTATANDRVVQDIRDQLGDLDVIRGSLDRESLSLSVLARSHQAERLAWLSEWIPTRTGAGIVYCLTVADTKKVADWLVERGVDAVAYSGDDDPDHRLDVERRLRANEVKAVCATGALGMGFDKPDLSFVVHFQTPDSLVAYYQQVGRAGRSILNADAVLLGGAEDEDIWDWFLRSSLPVQLQAEAVIAELDSSQDWVAFGALAAQVNMSHGRLETLLKVLDVEGAVEKERGHAQYRRTTRPWTFDAERIERVRDARLAEQQGMRDYVTTRRCRMRFIREALDDAAPDDCGRCDNCLPNAVLLRPSAEATRAASQFVRGRFARIEPRRQWVYPSSGRIPADHQAQEGRTLAYLSDPGYGQELLDAKRAGVPVSDDVVAASAALIRAWLPDFHGVLVPVPSFDLSRIVVPDFARRLGRALGVACIQPVVKVRHTEPQKLMENSSRQLRNILGAYEIRGEVPTGPVILVDDVSDSRWTMTVIADVLAAAGTRSIYPFAIAKTKG